MVVFYPVGALSRTAHTSATFHAHGPDNRPYRAMIPSGVVTSCE
jgi:hypothetical protein